MNTYDQAKQLVLVMLKPIAVPTPDDIHETITRVCGMLRATNTELGFTEEALFTDIETLVNVWIGTSTSLDNIFGHEDWLPTRRATIPWRFWLRYDRFLEEEKRWPPATRQRVGQLTDQVLERLEDPQRSGKWDRRGLVVGNVQSGKTANYTGLVCKAIDAGYKLIVVLTGMHNSLRSQTQSRLDEGVLGFDTKRNRAFDTQNVRIGVGALRTDEYLVAHSLTSSADSGDFKTAVKKHKTILDRLLEWVLSVRGEIDVTTGRRVIRNVPLLLIDDEADNASVNTNPIPLDENGEPLADYDVKAINGAIRKILSAFEKSAYVGYTATPFANIFIPPGAQTDTHGRDLFPESFIISLPTPSNYIGPARVFGINATPEAGIEEKTEPLPLVVPVEDFQTWMPDKHKRPWLVPSPLPGTLREAIRSFILVCAARRAREQSGHNSMLVHVTRFVPVQQQVAEQIGDELVTLQRRLEFGDGNTASKLVDELRDLWEREFAPKMADVARLVPDPMLTPLTWRAVKAQLVEAALRIKTRVINGSAGDLLDYADNAAGLSVIAIGGDKLSRGLTLEGLSVSYFLRASKMYDTLMQMGRWFGYRPGYLDLSRLYTTPELSNWYRHITLASEELRREFDNMAAVGGTPADYGLRVRTHPAGLIITAVNKMRTGTMMDLSYSGSITESVAFDSREIDGNFARFASFIEDLKQRGEPEKVRENKVWTDVEGAKVQALLSGISTHPESWKANSKLLSEYVQKKLNEQELTGWTVALISKAGGKEQSIGGVNVETLTRNLTEDGNKFSIGRLVSPIDEMIDFSKDKQTEALLITRERWRVNPGLMKEEPKQAAGPVIRSLRPPERGLLLIYPILSKSETPIMGFAISFPRSGQPTTIQYAVNNVYWEQEFGQE
jgi:hypothetical protein